MDKSSMNIPEIETLDYHSPLCKCSECEKNPAKITSQPTDPEYIKLTGYQLTREQPASAPQEGKEKTTPDIEPKTGAENRESVGQPQQPKCETCGNPRRKNRKGLPIQYCGNPCPPAPEQPDYSKCRHCGACRVVRPAGEWQFACKCNEDDKIYPPEQPKDNPGPLEKLIVDRIELDLENIAANLEMLKSATKEQNRAKCVLTLEIARITGKGGMFDDLKEVFE